jgi:hypothetical protein
MNLRRSVRQCPFLRGFGEGIRRIILWTSQVVDSFDRWLASESRVASKVNVEVQDETEDPDALGL